jgi:FkbM family methyltransferase
MTEWIVREGLLQSPFVLFDIGCQGGVQQRWRALGDCLSFVGFDALEEAVEELRRASDGPRRARYFGFALGNEESERDFFVQQNRCTSSMYRQDTVRREVVDPAVHTLGEQRRVRVRRLDALFAEGAIPRPDFIKLDVEGFEPEVLKGAQALLAASLPLGAEAETSRGGGPVGAGRGGAARGGTGPRAAGAGRGAAHDRGAGELDLQAPYRAGPRRAADGVAFRARSLEGPRARRARGGECRLAPQSRTNAAAAMARPTRATMKDGGSTSSRRRMNEA